MSLLSFAELMLSPGTSMTAAAPSRRLFAVATARPSFQKRSTTDPTMRTRPMSTPTKDLPILPKTDSLVTSVIRLGMVDGVANGEDRWKLEVGRNATFRERRRGPTSPCGEKA